jgi:hypothetical protein
MGKRDWSKYPGRLIKAYIGAPGLGFGLGGFVLAVAAIPGFAFATPFFILGGAIGGLGLLAGLWEAIPPEYREAAKLVGTYETLDNLENIYPPLFKVGIVGLSKAGKTTLLNYFCRIPEKKRKYYNDITGETTQLHVYIYALNIPNSREGKSSRYLAFIDGAGDQYADQFALAEASDFLCVVIDHDEKNDPHQLNKYRLEKQDEFLQQMSRHLDNKRANNPLADAHFLLNKRDIWENTNFTDKEELIQWFEKKLQNWKTARFIQSNKLSHSYHSNNRTQDMNTFENIFLNALNKVN